MPHPNKRLWTLEGLSRDLEWRLWFNHEAFRWDVAPLGLTQPADEDPWDPLAGDGDTSEGGSSVWINGLQVGSVGDPGPDSSATHPPAPPTCLSARRRLRAVKGLPDEGGTA